MKTNIGQYLKTMRVKNKKSQLEVSKYLGYENPQFISLIENGHSKLPLGIMKKYCDFLSIDSKQIKQVLISDYERGLDAELGIQSANSVKPVRRITKKSS